MAERAGPNPSVDASIREELDSEMKRGRKIDDLRKGDRFISLRFNSSNFGYVNIRNGDYYDMGQN
jgi:hypothetical protein